MRSPLFRDRTEAGRLLAEAIDHSNQASADSLVLALARGGVPVALEVSRRLRLPMEALIVRKVGAPGNPEFGIGAIAEDGVEWLDRRTIEAFDFDAEAVNSAVAHAREEVSRRIELYRKDNPLPDLRDRSVLIVDDGLATGVSARAAGLFARMREAGRVVLAVPIAAHESAELLRASGEFDAVITVREVESLGSVGLWYEEFGQLTDSETIQLLQLARRPVSGASNRPRKETIPTTIAFRLSGGPELHADLAIPERALGLVIFAHGSGSSRLSPRNRAVARALNRHGIATLLLDLLTPTEEMDRARVFDIELLSARLTSAADWASKQNSLSALPLGFFGASTGAAAALVAAAQLGDRVSAVVSRGGRPDLAGGWLERVEAPTLLMVGGLDLDVLELNESALMALKRGRLIVVEGATHLFEESGALEAVADESARFFEDRFKSRPARTGRRRAG